VAFSSQFSFERLEDIKERMELVRGNGTWVARFYLEDVQYLLDTLYELLPEISYDGGVPTREDEA